MIRGKYYQIRLCRWIFHLLTVHPRLGVRMDWRGRLRALAMTDKFGHIKHNRLHLPPQGQESVRHF